MFAKLSYTWELMGASWNVLKRDTRLLIFPLLSGICCLLVILSFAIPIIGSGTLKTAAADLTPNERILRYVILFLFYFTNYFVITFFNTAIISCAISRMAGGEPTIGGGLREAMKRIHLIFGWALVSASVGLILRIIEERSKFVGQIVAGLLGSAWALMTFLVVPVLVFEQKGPFAALKESASLFRKTWGEQLVGNFSFGLIFFLLAIPAWGSGIYGFILVGSHKTAIGMTMIGLAALYLVLLALIQSALQAIFQAAVYMYTQGVTDSSQGFPVKLLRNAMATK